MKNSKRIVIWLFFLFPVVALACGIGIPSVEESIVASTAAPQATIIPAEAPPALITTNEDELLIDLYNRINPAVVSIQTYIDQGRLVVPDGQGSGFVYDQEGHIITNSHVVHGAEDLEVVFADSTTLRAETIGEDLHSDLAVVKVESLPPGVTPIPLGDIDQVRVGQTVVAIGNPFGYGGTLTRGIVSALGRTIPALTSFSIPQAIQTDAPINPGNSGGPLLNLQGQVIGINAQIETDGTSRANSGVGFAIPVSIVSRVVPNLIRDGKYIWPWLGVRGGSLTPTLVEAMKLDVIRGAYLAQVLDNGPSAKAGLHGASGEATLDGRVFEIGGDVVIAVDGQTVNSFEDLLIYIALETTPGQSVTLTVLRDGQRQDFQVVLEPRPEEDFEGFIIP